MSTVYEHPAFVGGRAMPLVRSRSKAPWRAAPVTAVERDEQATPVSGATSADPPPARLSLAHLMLEVAATRSRLQVEIATARERLEQATSGITPERRAAEAELGALVLAAQRELTEIENEHQRSIAAIHDAAMAEATALLSSAREQALAAQDRAALLSSRFTPERLSPTDDD